MRVVKSFNRDTIDSVGRALCAIVQDCTASAPRSLKGALDLAIADMLALLDRADDPLPLLQAFVIEMSCELAPFTAERDPERLGQRLNARIAEHLASPAAAA